MEQVIGEVAALDSSSDSESDNRSILDERPNITITKKRKETFHVNLTRCMHEWESFSQTEKSLIRYIISGLRSFVQFLFATIPLETLAEETFHQFEKLKI
jgi:hypothetical protein